VVSLNRPWGGQNPPAKGGHFERLFQIIKKNENRKKIVFLSSHLSFEKVAYFGPE
jgi:hypothetical protein